MDLVAVKQLLAGGRVQDAARMLVEGRAMGKEAGELMCSLGQLALKAGDFGAAAALFEGAVRADGEQVEAANAWAVLLRRTGEHGRAVEVLKGILERRPGYAGAWFNLGNGLVALGRYEEAVSAYERAVGVEAGYADAYRNMGRAYRQMMDREGLMRCLRKAVELSDGAGETGGAVDAVGGLMVELMYEEEERAEEILEWGKVWDRRLGVVEQVGGQRRLEGTGRKLRVGYVGSVFRGHAVGFLLEGVLRRHDRERFEIFVYSDVTKPDEMTGRLRGYADVYRETARMVDEEFAKVIAGDGVDVLVDLECHLAGSRLGAMARRPSPVRVNYLAYPFSAGCSVHTHRVTDGLLEREKRWGPEARMVLSACFWALEPGEPVEGSETKAPGRERGHVVFGALNDPKKMNRRVAEVWGRILRRVEGSRLMMYGGDVEGQRKYFERVFAEAGIEAGRVDLVGKVGHRSHLEQYRGVDLALDPFPYGGHTTTVEAVYMGVPVVSLRGRAGYARGGASILPRVGLGELVVGSVEAYEELAVRLALDLDQLEGLRAGLRERVLRSEVGCAERLTRELERGYAEAWRQWQAGEPFREILFTGE